MLFLTPAPTNRCARHASRASSCNARTVLRYLPFIAAVLFCLAAGADSFVNFEGKQTSPARLSPDGTRLFVVNTPDNRLSVFDVTQPLNPILIAEVPVGLEPVSVNPVNNDEAWVVNEVSDSISVVSISRHVVTDTLAVKDEPADVVFANGRAFVTAARSNRIAVFDVTTHTGITNIQVSGENPRALAVNADGSRVYAAFALSGNRSTIIPANPADPRLDQPAPTNPALPAPPKVGRIVDATDPAWSDLIPYTMPDHDVVEIDTASLAITRYFQGVGTVNLGLAVQPGSGDLYVASQDARNLTRFEPVLRGVFISNQVNRVSLANGTVTRFDLNPGASSTFPSLPDLTNALAQPTAIAFGPSGNNFFVACFGTDRVALMDANSGAITARIELNPQAPGSAANPRTKRGPRGLALKPGQALYAANRISGTLSVINPGARVVVREVPVGSYDPTPAALRRGRGFLYDAKLSGNGTVSCASCHVDAEMDLLAWDLGDPAGQLATNRAQLFPGAPPITSIFHPMKGPMATQTLRGLKGLNPLHWRGDRTNFLHFNGAFSSLLGGSALSADDLNAYRDFIDTIVFQPNPNENLDRTLPESFAGASPRAGLTNFTVTQYTPGLTCNTCHALPTGTAGAIIPAAALRESQDFKIPHLRNLYQKLSFNRAPGAQSIGGFGFTHDGGDPDLVTFLSRPVFQNFANNGPIKSNLNALLLCLDTGTAPAVGYGLTLLAGNVNSGASSSGWSLLESQAATGTNIDLVVQGTLDGKQRGLLYDPAHGNYRPNSTNLSTFTRDDLRARVLAGDTLTLLGVPPGAGIRLGIDRDEDGVLDGDVPPPSLRIVRNQSSAIVAWPTNASGFVLERAPALPPSPWNTDTSLRGRTGNDFTVTNPISPSSLFFRLRAL